MVAGAAALLAVTGAVAYEATRSMVGGHVVGEMIVEPRPQLEMGVVAVDGSR